MTSGVYRRRVPACESTYLTSVLTGTPVAPFGQ